MESCIRCVKFICKLSVSLRRKMARVRTQGFHISCWGVGSRVVHPFVLLSTQDLCAKVTTLRALEKAGHESGCPPVSRNKAQ